MKAKRWGLFALLLASVAAFAQPSPPLLKASDLQAYVAILRRAYEQLHPGLYRYNTKAAMDKHFAALASRMNHDQPLSEAYLNLSVFAAEVKCGHTYANFFNQPKSVGDVLFKSPTRVPFYFEWIDNVMVVTRDFTPGHQLPRGTRILAIGSVPTPTILTRLMKIARADGSNNSKRIASLAVSGDSKYETFDIFYPLLFPRASIAMNLLVIRPASNKRQTVAVQALSYEERLSAVENDGTGNDVAFQWSYLPGGAAYLRMPTWALFNNKWDWKTWLNDHLDELADQKPPSLIVDLRGNEGGLDAGNPILARLVTKAVTLSPMRRFVRYRKVSDDLAPYLSTWDPSFKDWGKDAVELADPWPTAPPVPYLALKRYDDDANGDRMEPQGKHYGGKVVVLVDTNNSSATFQFAQIVQRQKLGVLIGQPTGGSQRGINGGAFFFLGLPNSKIELDVPLIATFAPQPMPDSGVFPDILVKRTAEDIAAGRDATLDAAIAWLKARPSQSARN